MKFPLLNLEGAKSDTIEISDKIIKLKVNYKLIKFVIDWQLNHLKPRTAKTKQRNEIRGSTRKIVAQKGSGGAVPKEYFFNVLCASLKLSLYPINNFSINSFK